MKIVIIKNIQTLLKSVARFSDTKFGNERDFKAPLHHLKKEIDEVLEKGDIYEYADCLLLLLDSFRKKYPNLKARHLVKISFKKLKICWKREWGEEDELGIIEHIKNKNDEKISS